MMTNNKSRKRGKFADMRRFAVLLRVKADTIARDYVDGFEMKSGSEYGKMYSTCALTAEDIKWIESLEVVTLNDAKAHREKTYTAVMKCHARKNAEHEEQQHEVETSSVEPMEELSFEEQFAKMLAEVEAFENEQAEQEGTE